VTITKKRIISALFFLYVSPQVQTSLDKKEKALERITSSAAV
jgi:hypothetical protein